MRPIGLIPRNRLQWIPPAQRYAHELCYFLHDECARILVECRECGADKVEIRFRSRRKADEFSRLADDTNPIDALRRIGMAGKAKKVVLNRITTELVSDSLHHLFEALRCMERRKVIVAMNLLRKPLKDNLTYLAWMLGDEDEFYAAFTSGDPTKLSQKVVGNHRKELFSKAIARTHVEDLIEAECLLDMLFNEDWPGFEPYFQHAVHLITVQRPKLKTAPENFNFIFKRPDDDELYQLTYAWLPYILLFMSHTVMQLFDRVQPMGKGVLSNFMIRSKGAYLLSVDGEPADFFVAELSELFRKNNYVCEACGVRLKVTRFNAASIILRQQYRCTGCGRHHPLPFSWMV
ncbi:MAG TPA: hypothetical protein VF138_01165 [Caulobacteraceae bacterium]